jgi:hypothetical protein
MRWLILVPAGVAVLLVVCAFTGAMAVKGPTAGNHKLDAQSEKQVYQGEFRAGQRACVIVMGDHDPVVNLGLFVYDANGNLVARDEGGGDFVAVIWYPPRTATYRVKLKNPGTEWNKCWVSVQ